MRTKLFDEERIGTLPGFKPSAMPAVDYFVLSNRPNVAAARAQIEAWFFSIPSHAQEHWRTRFLSKNDIHHFGAFSELVVHRILAALQLYPDFLQSRTDEATPDLRFAHDGADIFMEVATRFGDGDASRAHAAFADRIVEALDGIGCDWLVCQVSFEGLIRKPPSLEPIRRGVRRWLNGLDPNHIAAKLMEAEHAESGKYWLEEGIRDQIRFTFDLDGAKIVFDPIKVKKTPSAFMNICSVVSLNQSGWQSSASVIKRAIKSKSSKYDVEQPLICAINEISDHTSIHDLVEGMFGPRVVWVSVGRSEPPETSFSFDGALGSAKRPKSQRASGFFFLPNCRPIGFWRCVPVYAEHPWTHRKIPNPFAKIRSLTFDTNGSGAWSGPEISIGQLLGIDEVFREAEAADQSDR